MTTVLPPITLGKEFPFKRRQTLLIKHQCIYQNQEFPWSATHCNWTYCTYKLNPQLMWPQTFLTQAYAHQFSDHAAGHPWGFGVLH